MELHRLQPLGAGDLTCAVETEQALGGQGRLCHTELILCEKRMERNQRLCYDVTMSSSVMRDGIPRVVESTDRLPAFWDRNTAFIANLLGLFFENEQQTKMLAGEVGEIDSYGGRLLPIIDLIYAGKGRNLLALESQPEPSLMEYLTGTAGLSLPDIEILPHREYVEMGKAIAAGEQDRCAFLKTLRRHPADYIDGYVTDGIIEGAAGCAGVKPFSSCAGSRRGNNKWLLHEHLVKCGLPTALTEIAECGDDISGCLDRLQRSGYSAGVIKAPMGASGIGLVKVADLADRGNVRERVPDHFFTEGPCLVQGWLQPGEHGVLSLRSPSVQLFISDDEVVMYDITEQILSSDSIHEGNESPPPYLASHPEWRAETLRQAGIAGQWLHSCGYRGTASADFLLTGLEDGGFNVYVCELNARVTGATYPSVLAHHFMPDGAWLLRNLRFTEPIPGGELMGLLRTAHELFIPGESSHGIFPVNFNTGKDGLVHKGQFLCLAATAGGSKLLLKLAQLNLPCHAERD